MMSNQLQNVSYPDKQDEVQLHPAVAEMLPDLFSARDIIGLYVRQHFSGCSNTREQQIHYLQLGIDYIHFLLETTDMDKNYFVNNPDSVINRLQNEICKIQSDHLDLLLLDKPLDLEWISTRKSLKTHLKNFGIFTYGELLHFLLNGGRNRLLRMEGIGIKSIEKIEAHLSEHGLIEKKKENNTVVYASVYKPFIVYNDRYSD